MWPSARMGRGRFPAQRTGVRIWDLETGTCRVTLKGHTDEVNSVAITPDGKRILSGSDDKSVRVWDASSGRELAKLDGHTESFGQWSRCGTTLACFRRIRPDAQAVGPCFGQVSEDHRLRDGQCRRCLQHRRRSSGTRALSGHRDGRVRLWDLETGQCLATLKGHSDTVNLSRSRPTGSLPFPARMTRPSRSGIWKRGPASGRLRDIKAECYSVAISPDGYFDRLYGVYG